MVKNNDYLMENEKYFADMSFCVEKLKIIFNKLSVFNINIQSKQWFQNIFEIYVPEANFFYSNCKKDDFEIKKFNNLWMRRDFKSFLSEVEKFIKFTVRATLNVKSDIKFFRSINELDNIILKYKDLFNNKWIEQIKEIKQNLHSWRELYNENKHNEEKKDNSIFIDDKEKTISNLGNDVLEYVSDFVCNIMLPLLLTILKIKENES